LFSAATIVLSVSPLMSPDYYYYYYYYYYSLPYYIMWGRKTLCPAWSIFTSLQ